MPSQSAKQHRFMEAVAHNPEFAKKANVPQTVGSEFVAADKGKRLADVMRKMQKTTAPKQ